MDIREADGPGYGLADALAVPEPADAWLVSGRAPTVGDVLVAMEGRHGMVTAKRARLMGIALLAVAFMVGALSGRGDDARRRR
jgi:hypothetical protein